MFTHCTQQELERKCAITNYQQIYNSRARSNQCLIRDIIEHTNYKLSISEKKEIYTYTDYEFNAES